jgi:hypothetical protein
VFCWSQRWTGQLKSHLATTSPCLIKK